MVGLRMPIYDVICPKSVHDLIRDLSVGRITEEFIHCSSPPDIILQGCWQIASLFSWDKHQQLNYPLPTNTWACLTPLSTAGVSQKTASVATASCLLGILSAGFLDLRCFFMGKVLGIETPHWVDCSIVS